VIAELAERQQGRVARWQLRELGIGPDAINRRIRAGRLRRTPARGVYAVGHRIASRKATWMEAVLEAGPGAVLSHRAAAAHWGFLRSGRVEVTVPRALRTRRGIVRHHAVLHPDEVTVLDGIPVTTVARTLLDVAAGLQRRDLERAIHEAEYLRLYDDRELAALIDRHPRRPGVPKLRAIRAERNAHRHVSRRELEHRFLALVAEQGLPRPEVNVHLELDGELIEVDCLWRKQRLIVELDGWAAHGTRRAYERDRERDRRLVRAGWRVVRVTPTQLERQAEALARDCRALLAQAEVDSRASVRLAPAAGDATSPRR